jgi:hypothetical protein
LIVTRPENHSILLSHCRQKKSRGCHAGNQSDRKMQVKGTAFGPGRIALNRDDPVFRL